MHQGITAITGQGVLGLIEKNTRAARFRPNIWEKVLNMLVRVMPRRARRMSRVCRSWMVVRGRRVLGSVKILRVVGCLVRRALITRYKVGVLGLMFFSLSGMVCVMLVIGSYKILNF
jgi:hypothetical protein